MNTNIFKDGCLVSNRMLLWIGGALTLSVSIYLLSGCWHVLLDGAGLWSGGGRSFYFQVSSRGF